MAGQLLRASFSTPQTAEKTGTRSAVRLRAQFLDCFFSEQNGVLLGSSEENACVLMRTNDGGKSWDDLLANPDTLARYLPVEQFPTEKSLLESIVSAELRPASRTAVYLTVRYHPYESVHVYDFEAVRQAVLTADA